MASVSSSLRHLRCQQQTSLRQFLSTPTLNQRIPATIRTLHHETIASTNDIKAKATSAADPVPLKGITHARAVPASPSYFSRQPAFNDLYIRINNLLTKYHHLPTTTQADATPISWMKLEDMREKMNEPIKASHFSRVLRVARRLGAIEQSLRPAEVNIVLEDFQKNIDGRINKTAVASLDKFGRSIGIGKRKSSVARAFVVEGNGEILINGKPLNEAFGRVHDRESAVWALTATQRLDKYNIWARVEGGGTTGQAEALTLAVARALLAHEPALKPALRKAGCITRDPRAVERKKHGHLKARKSPTWVKR